MRRISKKARLIVLIVAMMLVSGAYLAFAAWLTGGSGSGYAKAGQSQNLSTIDVSADAATLPNLLYPGANGDVLIKIHNPNGFPVRVTGISGSGTITASGGSGTCTTTGVTFTNQTGLSIDVAAGADSAETTLTGAAHMDNTSDNGCQGATFTIPVTLTGQSNAS